MFGESRVPGRVGGSEAFVGSFRGGAGGESLPRFCQLVGHLESGVGPTD
jgi:hypothetical protein